jgi:simple sugar transport system substrate-binding protein
VIPKLLRLVPVIAALAISAGGVAGAQTQPTLQFIMVTHGAATDPFWATIKEGADRAAADASVEVAYQAPETFDLDQMAGLLTAAVEEAPDGLIVSIPNADAVAGPIRSAVEAGIPVITINSGFDVARSLGSLLHVGQSEYEAGRVAGDAMRKGGGTKALCLNHELGNVALDLRCKGFIDGFAGSVEVLPVAAEPEQTGKAIGDKLAEDTAIDVILALNATIAGEPAIAAAKALPEGRRVRVATFDMTRAVLQAVAAGEAAFAIDQQPFLQGYLPVQYLALLVRHGVVPVSNVSTGPRLITAEDAKRRLGPATPSAPAEAAPTPAEPAEPEAD